MKKVIYSLYVDVPAEEHYGKSKIKYDTVDKASKTVNAFKKHYKKLIDVKRHYANASGATFIMYEYDIKYKTEWADKINGSIKQQWYPLDDLEKDISAILEGSKRIVNLGSEPILNKDIVDQFSNGTTVDQTVFEYDLKPYKYTKEEIFDQISLYLRG